MAKAAGKRGRKAPPRVRRRPVAPVAGGGERLELAMRAINEGVYDWDIADGSAYYSEGVYSVLHLPRSMKTPADWRARIHPDDLAAYDAAILAHFKKKTRRFECDYRYRARDGNWRWARQHGIAMRDAKGRAVRMIGSTGDISELKRAEAARRQSDERYAFAMSAINEGVYDWNIADGSAYYSDRVMHAVGLTRRQLRNAADWHQRIHPEDRPRFDAALVAHFKGKTERFECDVRYRASDGGWRWARQHGVAVRDANGRALRMVGSSGDINELKLAELELHRAHGETKEALERQAATAEILKVIASSPSDVKPVFDAIVASAQRLLRGTTAHATRVEGGSLHLVAYSMTDAAGVDALKGVYPLAIAGSPAEPIFSSGVARIVADIETEHGIPERIRAAMRARGVRSNIWMPMRSGGMPIGTIIVNRAQPGKFTQHEIDLLQTFADQAVIAIENVRLFNETKEALEQQTMTAEILRVIGGSMTDTQPVFDAIVKNCHTLFKEGRVLLRLVKGDLLHAMASVGESEDPVPIDRSSAVGNCVLDARTVHLPDLAEAAKSFPRLRQFGLKRGYRSGIFAPLLRAGKAIGTISVLRHELGAFDAREVALLNTFADQAVIAIENVRLFNETKEALERQTAISEILRVISSSPSDVRPVLDAVAERAARICEAQFVDIIVSEGDTMRVGATFGDLGWPIGEAVPLDRTTVMGRSIVDKQTVHVADLQNAGDEFPLGQQLALKYGHRTILAVPLVREDRALGTILVRRTEVRPFEDKHIALLATFADQAAIAIQNVRLFNETKEALERQTATAEILKVIASSPSDLRPVFDAILQNATRLCDSHLGVLNLYDGEKVRTAAQCGGKPEFVKWLFGRGAFAPTPGSSFAQMLSDGQPYSVADLREAESYRDGRPITSNFTDLGGARSLLLVPLLKEGAVIGILAIYRPEVRPFTDKQTDLVRTFADQAVIAIENVRLFNETKEALERQTATAEILKVIASSPSDVKPVFDVIVASAQRLLRGTTAHATRVEGGSLHLVAYSMTDAAGVDALKGVYPLAIAGSPDEPIFSSGVARIIADIETEHGIPERILAAMRARGVRSNIMMPMRSGGMPIGTIIVNRAQPGKFTQHEIDLLQTFADQAVIAIENVRLFKELQSRTEALSRSVGQLTALGEVGQAISSTLDLETVLQTIVSRAVQLTGLDGGAIYEYDERAEEFRLQAAENYERELLEAVRRTPIRKGDGTVGGTAVTLEPAQVPDILDGGYHSSRKDLLIREGYRAVLSVPLLREDHVIGALSVSRKAPGPFAPEIVELLKTFATQSAMAIQNARLFREIAEKGKQLELASQHKSQFLASMSHELRTPLNAILGFNEMILDQVYGEVSADVKAPLENIQSSGKHLLRLINNVLDLAKIEAGRMELSLSDYAVQDTVASVHATLKPLATEKGLEFLVSVSNDIPLGFGDSGRIAQCLMNLAGNSLKFTKAGKVEISVVHEGDLLRYSVADTGIGIPPDKIASLFTEFKQTDATIASEYGGTGLGLSITKKFIEMHGGRIWIESELGKGSVFLFEIPLRVSP